MKSFMVLATLVTIASGDVGINLGTGYQYGKPSGSYIPVSPVGLHNRYAGDGTYSPANTHYTTSYTTRNVGGYPGNYNGYTTTTTTHHQYTTFVAPSFPGFHQQQQQQQHQQQQHTVAVPTVVHQKFFFDAPEDLGETHVRIHVQPAAVAAQKSIFIKAPAYNSKVVPHFNLPLPLPAEKTKVYVLVKKPEEQQDIVVPAPVQAPTAQPEVFFVKYKNQHEAEQKVQDIQEGAIVGGESARKVHSDHELVGSIKDGVDAPSFVHHSNDLGVVVNGAGTTGSDIHPTAGGINTNVVTISGPTITSGGGIVSSTTIKTTNYGPAGESGPY